MGDFTSSSSLFLAFFFCKLTGLCFSKQESKSCRFSPTANLGVKGSERSLTLVVCFEEVCARDSRKSIPKAVKVL